MAKNKNKKWNPRLDFYEEIIAVECLDEESFGKLMASLTQKKFEDCPYETVWHALIIPESIKNYLNLYAIRHRIARLIHVSRLSEEILYVIDIKCRHAAQPNFYGFGLFYSDKYVELAVAEQIQENLNSGEIKLDLKKKMVSVYDLEKNINALAALAGENITDKQWEEILKSEQVIGNADLLNSLHDYLLNHGEEIDTADKLRELVQIFKR